MTNSSWSLDDLTINTDSRIEARGSLTRQQTLVLGWFVFNSKDRSYIKMARDCSLTMNQCETAVEELMEANIIRFR